MKESNTDRIGEIYRTLLEQEISNHTIFITVLLGIVVILLGATWWWNKSGAKKEIHNRVEKKFEKEKKEILKQLEIDLEVKINKKIKDYKENVLVIEGDVARSMAISARNNELYSHSIYWLAKFLKTQIELKKPEMIREGTEWILEDLKLLKENDDNKKLNSIHGHNFIVETVSELPELLEKEKKKILKICKGREEEDEEDEEDEDEGC
ncbi:hypothetical protein SB49_01275 [Sediminicola sp. YIK13]|uniref:hypothetical protein n=1 Tax=Sediminicola sp. YIK13 TaxID=1453352 RepID=UPI000721EA37|nr:hypothetical protein [Sediminicola sp. YIK13]ALM06593.1 hypothetical protein SB49_01275 [Sediminicola sp. YIK13]